MTRLSKQEKERVASLVTAKFCRGFIEILESGRKPAPFGGEGAEEQIMSALASIAGEERAEWVSNSVFAALVRQCKAAVREAIHNDDEFRASVARLRRLQGGNAR